MSLSLLKAAKTALILIGASPIVAWITLMVVAGPLRCEVNEAGPNSCPVGRFDIGPMLYALGNFVTIGGFTLPVTLPVYFVLLLVVLSAETKAQERDHRD